MGNATVPIIDPVRDDLLALAQPLLEGAGVELVELHLGRAKHRLILRLDIDRAGPVGVTIDDCQRVSRAITAALDDSDLIEGNYVLEVSSPGLDRPIRTADDIRRNTGRRVVVRTAPAGAGQVIVGVLLGASGDDLLLQSSEGTAQRIPLTLVALAHQEIDL